MKILYLADPNSIHDIKWIQWFQEKKAITAFLLPRSIHAEHSATTKNFQLVGTIPNFSIVRFWRTLFVIFKIKRIIKKYKIDLIHIMYAEPNALWCLFRKYFDTPMIITCRGTDVLVTIPQAFQKKNLIDYIVAPAYNCAFLNADWITTTSTRQIESIKKFCGRSEKISIIRTGVDLERLSADTSQYFVLRDARPYVLFPRYIKPIYNHEFNLKAISCLPLEIKKIYKMVFVGKDSGEPAYQAKLEKLMKEQADVSFEFIEKQSQESIFELYKRASLIVMTPISDGSPVSGMEAMLCETPLILGPLNYDHDIFNPAIRLKNWDERELASSITNVLTGVTTTQNLSKEMEKSIDRNQNMQLMSEIYQRLVQ